MRYYDKVSKMKRNYALKELGRETKNVVRGNSVYQACGWRAKKVLAGILDTPFAPFLVPTILRRLADRYSDRTESLALFLSVDMPLKCGAGVFVPYIVSELQKNGFNDIETFALFAGTNLVSGLYEVVKKAKKNLEERAQ